MEIKTVKGNELPLVQATIRDETAKCRIALWQNLSTIQAGQSVRLTSINKHTYRKEDFLQTTSDSKHEVKFSNLYFCRIMHQFYNFTVLMNL